jgi:hypothetical protein
VTRTLSDDEARRLRPLIAANRRLRALVTELESLTVSEFANDERIVLQVVGKRTSKAGKRPRKGR